MLRLPAVLAALALTLHVDEALGAKPLFDDLHSEVVTLSKLNFNNNIKKNRDDHVSIVLFYTPHGARAPSSPREWRGHLYCIASCRNSACERTLGDSVAIQRVRMQPNATRSLASARRHAWLSDPRTQSPRRSPAQLAGLPSQPWPTPH